MYLLYLDDSGSVTTKSEKHVVLGGVSVFERQIHWITQRLNDLAKEINPDNPGSVEFHASEIYAGRIPPWKNMEKEKRREIICRVLGALAESHETTRAFACAIEKTFFPNHDPMELAFEDMCSRFDMYLKRVYFEGDSHKGLIVLDESSYETSLQKLSHDLRSSGTRWGGTLKNLPEAPLFADSKVSRLIQLADHIAYAVFRRYESFDTRFLDIILKKFDMADGILHGLKHKTSDANCSCQSCFSRK